MSKRDVGMYCFGMATGWFVLAGFYFLAMGLYVFAIPLLVMALLCYLIFRAIRNEVQAYKWRKAHK